MSRLASQSKGGYYPTPIKMGELIAKRLIVNPGSRVNLLDPCAGKGEILRFFQEDLTKKGALPVSYGVELEQGRYEEASSVIDHMVHGGYETFRTSPYHTFLWGNPPYDDGDLERMEVTFLRHMTHKTEKRRLQHGALVALCVPQYVLGDLASLVSARLDEVRVYRFTDPHFEVFKQVVLFGYFRDSKEKRKEIREYLKSLSKMDKDLIPTLDEEDGVFYTIPEAAQDITYFRADPLNLKELEEDLRSSSLYQEIEEMMMPSSLLGGTLKRPPLPLKIAHMATAIAANAIDGNMGGFWMSGYTAYRKDKNEVTDEEGKKIREEIIHTPISVTRIFHPVHGVIDLE